MLYVCIMYVRMYALCLCIYVFMSVHALPMQFTYTGGIAFKLNMYQYDNK
jgi:hypothetical protein